MVIRLCAFGDSITRGSRDAENEGWVGHLRRYLEKENNIGIYNVGISGNSSFDLLDRFEAEAKARRPEIVLVLIGINDSAYFDNDKNRPRGASLPEFKKNLLELVYISRKAGYKIGFLGLTNVDEKKVQPLPWRTDIYYDNDNIRKYDAAIQEVCKEQKIKFLELFGLLDENDLFDGLHPNANGYKKIYGKVKLFVEENFL